MVNAESDFLSGLVVISMERAVPQTSSLGMDQRKNSSWRPCRKSSRQEAILERNELSSRKFEGLPDANGVLCGEFKGPINIRLNDLSFEVNLENGPQDRALPDQQVNYQLVSEFALGSGA